MDLGYEVIILDNLSTGTLANLNPNARFISMSLLDNEVSELIKKEKPDIINHHAAQVNVRNSVADPFYDIELNLLATVRLLEAAGHAGVKNLFSLHREARYMGQHQISQPQKNTKQIPFLHME